MTVQITVLGLGPVGASIGLALAAHKDSVMRMGNDREISVMRQAERMGAFDKTAINLHDAVENAGVVILALPVDEIEETLKVIADDLGPGTVVVDTSPVKVAVAKIAQRVLGAERHFVTLTSSLNPAYLEELADGLDGAHADLFKNSTMTITSPPGTHPDALELAANLAGLLGGKPYFTDPYEADGLAAASHTLPALAAAALVHAVADQPGWSEGRRLAGQSFALTTHPVAHLDESKVLGQSALLNRENVVRMLDSLQDCLQELRDLLQSEDADALDAYLRQAQETRALWLKQRHTERWEEMPTQAAPTAGEVFGKLFVGTRSKKSGERRR